MTTFAAAERARLCDTALQVGEAEPTLSGDWTVKDLVAHMVVREGHPAAAGLVVPPLAPMTEWASRRTAKQDFPMLVERLRKGAPFYSPMTWTAIDKRFNTLEFFIHHEDIRRAQSGWEPRVLEPREESALWKTISVFGKTLTRGAEVGVSIERTDRPGSAVLASGEPMVTIKGMPSEIALFVYGRKRQSRVELTGDPAAVKTLRGTDLSL